jgi:hypothetical protein
MTTSSMLYFATVDFIVGGQTGVL